MAHEQALMCVTLEASTNLSNNQYRLVKVASNGRVELCGNGEQAVGVLQNRPNASGAPAAVGTCGKTKLVASSGTAAGAVLQSGANGIATVRSGGGIAVAVACEAAPAASDGIITAVLL